MAMNQTTQNLRVKALNPLISPAILRAELPIYKQAATLITSARQQAQAIIEGRDDRLLAIVGPCSIHDPQGALAYASLLKEATETYQEELHILMRVYFEKPRTTIGWKGLINDPGLDNTFDINHGLKIARKLLLDLCHQGIAPTTEFLDTIVPQFLSDLIAWGAIGARTTESQIHRELVSGLSMPVGFKNGTDGNVQIAIDAIGSAQHPHHFLGITDEGLGAIVTTTGNQSCHVILRGSKVSTNYDAQSINAVVESLRKKQLTPRLMVDCSHGNSNKDHRQQVKVASSLSEQISSGSSAILGIMLESNLRAGNQPLKTKAQLIYGQSITDACIDWAETVTILEKLARAVKIRRNKVKGKIA